MVFDFFELDDAALSAEEYSQYLSSSLIGTLDEYEMAALKDFFASCIQFGVETENRYVFTIPSRLLPKVYAHLKVFPFSTNLWHQEVRDKLAQILQQPLKNGKGVLAMG